MEKAMWVVTIRCVVQKSVTCADCTEEQAKRNPFEYAIEELETDQEDYDVLSVHKVD
jgi:hypothetical protein